MLKYPVHLKHLAALLAVYPDACIVQTHRDPTQVMASYVELIAGFRAIFERDIDRAAIAREQLEVWAAGAERAIAVRAAHDPAQFHDVFFARLRRRSDRASCAASTSASGSTLSPEAERRMRAWQGGDPDGGPGPTTARRRRLSAFRAPPCSIASPPTCGTSISRPESR